MCNVNCKLVSPKHICSYLSHSKLLPSNSLVDLKMKYQVTIAPLAWLASRTDKCRYYTAFLEEVP